MKKIAIISTLILSTAVVLVSCGGKTSPGSIYMPDMAYSRAYEDYALLDSNKFTTDPHNKGGEWIYYNSMPVPGTIKRGELYPYTLPNDSNGYKMSATVPNPLDSLSAADMAEAGRLYNINCGICHGEKGTATGPLATTGKVGGIANLTLPLYVSMTDGTMFHSITYGKNNMGSYASQLDRKQRWMVIKYVRTLQPKAGGTTPATTDTAAVVKKG